MQNYNNTIIIYDELVEALESIIECSLTSTDESDFNYLDIKYEPEVKNKFDNKQEKILYNAIRTLQKNIDTTSKVIRTGLERELATVEDNIIKLDTEYLIGQEKRKLSIQPNSVNKIRKASLDIDILYKVPLYKELEMETALETLDNIDTNKIFSEFEKKVISDFPGFFKEEIELAKDSSDDTIEINNLMSHEFVAPEDITFNKNNRLRLIEGAINKARKLGDMDLVVQLEEKYNEELKSS